MTDERETRDTDPVPPDLYQMIVNLEKLVNSCFRVVKRINATTKGTEALIRGFHSQAEEDRERIRVLEAEVSHLKIRAPHHANGAAE